MGQIGHVLLLLVDTRDIVATDAAQPAKTRAAVCSASALIFAGCLGADPNEIALARNGVDLAAEAGDPEIVDDIGGFNGDQHVAVCGDIDLIGGNCVRIGIADPPPPLMAGNDDIGRTPHGPVDCAR